MSGTMMPAKDRFPGHLARLTVLFTGIPFVVISLIAAYDYLDSRTRPHEHATVLAEVRVPSSACTGGHAPRAQYRVTWRSDNPPRDLPAVFTQGDSCRSYPVGHTATVIRRHRVDGSLHIEVSPFDSVTDELVLVGAGTVLSVPIGFLLALWWIWKGPGTTREHDLASGP